MSDYESEIEPVEEPTNTTRSRLIGVLQKVIIHAAVLTYLIFAILKYINSSKVCPNRQLSHKLQFVLFDSTGDDCENDCDLTLCSPFGMLIFVVSATYAGLLYFTIIKPYFGKWITMNIFRPIRRRARHAFDEL